MQKNIAVIFATSFLMIARAAGTASAHGVVGDRFFPATLAIDDPFVADELSLPTISTLKAPASDSTPSIRETDYSLDISKRLSPELGAILTGTYQVFHSDDGSRLTGLDNFDSALMYQFLKNAEHEAVSSLKVNWSMGGTGNRLIGDPHSTFTPSWLFGKGFTEMPDSLKYLRPLALTGTFGTAFPAHSLADDGSVIPKIAQWGFTLQYSLQYLQANVKDIGLGQPFSHMIPVIELPMQTQWNGVQHGQTTGTVNPGLICFNRYIQVAIEAQLPINKASGAGTGVIGQLHFYLDDIAPAIFTWTPLNGILGPTQPR